MAQTIAPIFSYSHVPCDKQTEFCVNLSGLDGSVSIFIQSNNFDVQTNGDYTPLGVGSWFQTGSFMAFADAPIAKCLQGEILTSGSTSFDVVVYLNGTLVYSQNISTTVFEEIDGTSTDVFLSDLYSTNGPLLPPSQANFTPQKIKIAGTLVIDENYRFPQNSTGQSEIVMEAGAKIVVEPGITFAIGPEFPNITLGIVKSQIYGCGGLWDKIEIKEGAQVSFWGVKVEDGDNAIYINNNDDPLNLACSPYRAHHATLFSS